MRFSKFILFVVILMVCLGLTSIIAQVPQLINYQGRLTDSSTPPNPLTGNQSVEFHIFDAETGGTDRWSETHNNIPVNDGIFQVLLGSVTPFPVDIFTSAGDRWLEIRVNSEILSPRSRITSVAYSLRTAMADSVADGAINTNQIQDAAVTLQKINTTGAAVNQVLRYSAAGLGWATPPSSLWSEYGSSDIYRASGNVGIGLSVPIYPLDIATSNIANTARIIHNGSTGNTISRGLVSDATNTTSTGRVWGASATGTNNNAASTAETYGIQGIAGGTALGPKYGVYGSAIGGGTLWAGYFSGNVNVTGDLSLSGDVSTDLNVTGTVTADNLAYSNARTHYYSLPSEAFTSNGTYYNTGGNGGVYLGVPSGVVTAPVNLPDGATVTRFTVYFNDTSSEDVTCYLNINYFNGGYGTLATVTSNTNTGYYNLYDNSINLATINNSTYAYLIYCYSTGWSSTLKIMGAVIEYTLAEAQ